MIEFNLSQEIMETGFKNKILGIDSVKEFIKRLKEVLPDATFGKTSIHKDINKLAGSKLIECKEGS